MGYSKKKNKKPLPPREKRMNQNQRLASAKQWVDAQRYGSKQLVRAYAKKYGVSLEGAVAELAKLDVKLDMSYVEAMRKSREGLIEARRRRKLANLEDPISNWTESAEDVGWGYLDNISEAVSCEKDENLFLEELGEEPRSNGRQSEWSD